MRVPVESVERSFTATMCRFGRSCARREWRQEAMSSSSLRAGTMTVREAAAERSWCREEEIWNAGKAAKGFEDAEEPGEGNEPGRDPRGEFKHEARVGHEG